MQGALDGQVCVVPTGHLSTVAAATLPALQREPCLVSLGAGSPCRVAIRKPCSSAPFSSSPGTALQGSRAGNRELEISVATCEPCRPASLFLTHYASKYEQ